MATPPTSDLEILSAARDGDPEAGRRLIADHGASMLRTAWNVLGSYGGGQADDVVQESLIAALTTSALPVGDLGAWLRAITVRKALDAVRAHRRRAALELDGFDGARELSAPRSEAAPAEILAVRQALSRLSPADRGVLVLVDVEGYTMAEAARTLGTTSVAVRLRAVRARRKLARLLRSDGQNAVPAGLEGKKR